MIKGRLRVVIFKQEKAQPCCSLCVGVGSVRICLGFIRCKHKNLQELANRRGWKEHLCILHVQGLFLGSGKASGCSGKGEMQHGFLPLNPALDPAQAPEEQLGFRNCNHKLQEYSGLEGTFKNHPVQPPYNEQDIFKQISRNSICRGKQSEEAPKRNSLR